MFYCFHILSLFLIAEWCGGSRTPARGSLPTSLRYPTAPPPTPSLVLPLPHSPEGYLSNKRDSIGNCVFIIPTFDHALQNSSIYLYETCIALDMRAVTQ